MTIELVNFGDAAPSGENLEYEPVFTTLEEVARPSEERQAGDEIIPGEDPDWKAVIAAAEAVLEQSHDLRAAVYLAQAELRWNGLPGFAPVMTWIHDALTEYWETVHPQLDEDDGDPMMRINAVKGLAAPGAMGETNPVVRALMRAGLTQSRAFGEISLRDIAIAEGEIPAPDGVDAYDSAAIAAAFQDTPDEVLTAILAAAEASKAAVQGIDAVFDAQTPGQGPDFSALTRPLDRIIARLTSETGGDAEAAEDDAADAPDGGAAEPASSGGGGLGAINTPADVEKAIDRIVAYYNRHEPSSPVPVILLRARKLVGADFLTIVEDMAPLGIDNVKLIGGIVDEESEY
ncbi:type VI secretion system protein TssA [Rhodobacteraceae bacterium CCMM004]|nr:type VI secretion system protein TssA [Rhodobacteraceae bacterium CCMM004]